MKEGKFELPPKKENHDFLDNLKLIQLETEKEDILWDSDIYNDVYTNFINLTKDANPDLLNEEERLVYKNVLLNQLNILIDLDFRVGAGAYGWGLDSNFSEVIKNFVNIKNSKFFDDNLEILSKIGDFYDNFLRDKFKGESDDKRPVEKLMDSLYKDSLEENSNLLLSIIIKQIKDGSRVAHYSQGLVDETLVYIGDNRYANLSSVSFHPKDTKISKKEDFDRIKNLLDQKEILEKEYKEDIKNEEKYLINEDDFFIFNGEKFFSRKENNKYNQKEEKFEYKKRLILMKIEALLDEEVNRETFSKSKKINNILNPIIFSIIWSDKLFRSEIESSIGISFYDFNLPEQSQIINFLKSLDNNQSKLIKRFSDKYKKNGFRTFLSIEHGGKELGDKIITLGEKLPDDVAQKVFAKYGEIINTVDNTEEEIKKIFGNKDIPNKVLLSVKETLLKRGAKMLSDLGDKVLDPNFKVNEVEILKELDDIKEETIILGESCSRLYREGIQVPLEEITKIEEISVLDLSTEEKNELLKVYINGRPKVTYENPDHLKLLEEEFKQELDNKNTSVFNIRFNGDIIIFAIVDKKDNDTLYIGGLTFVDDVRNPVIAEASMNLVLEKFKNYNIKALVDSKNPILAMYQKRFGFKIVGELPKEENAGELYYEIERPKDKKEIKIEKEDELEQAA